MKLLRTPDDRFAGLPGYGFPPRYVDVDGLRVHYVDEGRPGNETVLLLHGEPTWSYMFRDMIPPLVEAGYRVVAPDLPGFGRSDKPADRSDYTYERHVGWMRRFLEALDLRHVNLFCHDWGGLIGLRLVAEDDGRFARVSACNTFLPTGETAPSQAFLGWQRRSQEMPVFDVGRLVNGVCVVERPPGVIAAYDAPFPDEGYRAGARVFPVLVPTTPDDPASAANREAWKTLRRWRKPFQTIFSDHDAVTRGSEAFLQSEIPGAEGQPHRFIDGAGHHLPEEKGREVAEALILFLGAKGGRAF